MCLDLRERLLVLVHIDSRGRLIRLREIPRIFTISPPTGAKMHPFWSHRTGLRLAPSALIHRFPTRTSPKAGRATFPEFLAGGGCVAAQQFQWIGPTTVRSRDAGLRSRVGPIGLELATLQPQRKRGVGKVSRNFFEGGRNGGRLSGHCPAPDAGEGGVGQQNGRGRRTLTAVAQDAHGPVVCPCPRFCYRAETNR
jgi:hypothetical protein